MEVNKLIQNITIGSDPEAFLVNKSTGEVVSAIDLIPGSKEEPSPMIGLPDGFNIQTDNVMVEWCVPAVTTAEELYNNIQKCIAYTNGIIPSELEVLVVPSAYLDSKYLKSKKATTFGCEPSFNAWTYTTNDAPSNKTNLRTAGGHIHIGYDNPNEDVSIDIVRTLDLFLNVPSLILDKDTERKKMYGKAGEFRFKSYGVEFRGLSNYWIANLEYTKFVFEAIKRATTFINNGEKISDENQFYIQEAINTNNKELAHKLINEYQLDLVLV